MALIICPECSTMVSSQTSQCIHCGYPLKNQSTSPPPLPVSDSDPPSRPAQPNSNRREKQRRDGYVAVLPPLQIRPLSILVGLGLIFVGLVAAVKWIPERDPERLIKDGNLIEIVGAVAEDRRFLKPELVGPAKMVAWVLVLIGAMRLIVYSTKRSGYLAYCHTCDREVVARPGSFRWYCERCQNRVRL